MKILVTGVGGQLGFDVMNELAKRGHEGIGSDILAEVTSIDAPYVQMDITDGDAVSKNIKEIKPDAVIHCAAWTAVDAAEDEDKQEKVFAINSTGTENIAKGEFRFAQSEYIEPELENLLNKLKKENYLEGLDKKELAIKLAYYLAELNVLHPFREGNGRTNREFIRQLALKNGYKLDLKKVKAEQILEASIESIVDTKKLEEIIYECLQLGTAPNCP